MVNGKRALILFLWTACLLATCLCEYGGGETVVTHSEGSSSVAVSSSSQTVTNSVVSHNQTVVTSSATGGTVTSSGSNILVGGSSSTSHSEETSSVTGNEVIHGISNVHTETSRPISPPVTTGEISSTVSISEDVFPPSDEMLISIFNQLVASLTAEHVVINSEILVDRFHYQLVHRYPLFDARIVNTIVKLMVSQYFINLKVTGKEPWYKNLHLFLTAHLSNGTDISLPPSLACLQNSSFIALASQVTVPDDLLGALQSGFNIGQETFRNPRALFGVDFSPYVRHDNYEHAEYGIDDIKTMLRVAHTRFHSIHSYELGSSSDYATSPVTLIGPAAAELNLAYNDLSISVLQSARVLDSPDITTQPDIEAAFSSAIKANNVYTGTVWGITLGTAHAGTCHVTDIASARLVAQEAHKYIERARSLNLKLGANVDNCQDILGGNAEARNMLIDLANSTDYIICNEYPQVPVESGEAYFAHVKENFIKIREAFLREVRLVDIYLGTGIPSQGEFTRNPASPPESQSLEKFRAFWEHMMAWSQADSVRVFMHEAFNIPDNVHEPQMGYFMRAADNRNRYFEKISNHIVKFIK